MVPDAALLLAPDAHFPLFIDPSYSTVQYRWTMVNSAKKDTSYWTDDYYREDVRVGKVYGSSDGPWRTFFQVNVAPVARATISRAWFSINMTHTGSCSATSVELWHTKAIDPAVAVTWNNSSGNWLDSKALDTQSGKANKSACAQPAVLMEFGLDNASVKDLVQQAATGSAGPQETLGFGLRIPSAHEGDQNYWKRFQQATARLQVEYNTAPLVPTSVSTVPPTPCGTATAPTALNTTGPVFGAVGYDPNGDNISNDVEVLSGDTVLTTMSSGTVGPGTAVRWPPVSDGILPADQPGAVFSYQARTRDAALAGSYSTRCYFTVDPTRPAPPGVASTDFPGSTAVKYVGEPGTATLTRAAADTDVVGFQYGFSQEAATMWIAARPDGTASVPITLWPASPGDVGDVNRTLFARSVDRAGNASSLSAGLEPDRPVPDRDHRTRTRRHQRRPAGRLHRAGGPGQQPDRRVDLRDRLGRLVGRIIGWDTAINGGFPVDRIRSVTGDFDRRRAYRHRGLP